MATHAANDRPEAPGERPGDDVTAPGQTINPLQRLIQERLRDRGWSYGVVARRGGLPRSTVYTLATTRNLVRPPRPATIDALAKGLDVPVSMVRMAAAESTGLHYYDETPAGQAGPDDRERELLIASIDELSPDDRRHVAALVESLRNRTSPDQQIRLPAGELALDGPDGGERRDDRETGPGGQEAADGTVGRPAPTQEHDLPREPDRDIERAGPRQDQQDDTNRLDRGRRVVMRDDRGGHQVRLHPRGLPQRPVNRGQVQQEVPQKEEQEGDDAHHPAGHHDPG